MIHWGLKTQNNQSVQETEQCLYIFYLWSADRSNCPELVHTTVGVWHVVFFFLLYGRTQTYKCVTATDISNGPLKLLIEIVDRVSLVHLYQMYHLFMILWYSRHVLFSRERACLASCWSVVFGSRLSCLEFRFRVVVRTLALHVLSHCVSVRSRVRSAARSSVDVCLVVLHAVRVFIGCVHSCYVLCEHVAYEFSH